MAIGFSQIGATKQQITETEQTIDKLTIPVEKVGQYMIHPIGNLKRLVRRWVPVLTHNRQEGTWKTSKALVVGDSPLLTVLEKWDVECRKQHISRLNELDHALTEEAIDKKSESSLKPQTHFTILAFDCTDPEPIVKRVHLKWSAWKELRDLQTKPSLTRQGYLMNGPMYAMTVLVEHKKDDSKPGPEIYKHSYAVSAYDAPHRDKFTADILENPPTQEIIDMCFTPEEQLALAACDIDLDKETKAMTDDEIREIFKSRPLNLGLMDENQMPVFVGILTNLDTIIQELDSLGINYVKPGSVPQSQRTLGTGQQTTTRVATAPKVAAPVTTAAPVVQESKIEDAQFTSVDSTVVESPKETTVAGDDLLGWESEDEMTYVLENFKPSGKLQEVLFKNWTAKDGTKTGFNAKFPGALAEIFNAKEGVEKPPEADTEPTAQEAAAEEKSAATIPVGTDKKEEPKKDAKPKVGKPGGARW